MCVPIIINIIINSSTLWLSYGIYDITLDTLLLSRFVSSNNNSFYLCKAYQAKMMRFVDDTDVDVDAAKSILYLTLCTLSKRHGDNLLQYLIA